VLDARGCSIDVHTHCGYQTMLDEAIAIVMAPTDRCGCDERWWHM